ncbi:ATP-grasp domain-containing protein [Oceanispirochaeta sp.]|jgi:biotin carboxylase|uniref:ATP-grasp domain-containing protein n=1 Tax=Oceanispirochaeta sp. TaxID=2035350 RepID=UPI002630A3D0|nr:ATP-grasp domain-containing protein [Oceanispirochaeta sp.]MDA3956983.1 ATP-grasp domain-containing protein [Oceanispirochaeta sp.]
MSQPAIIILGAGIMQMPAFDAARKNNWYSIAADGNPHAPCISRADEFLNIDLKDRVGLVEAAENLMQTRNIQGVFTCGTDFSASVAWIAEKLNLPGIPYQSALDCTDKYRMRMKFQEHNIPIPAFCELSADMDAHEVTKRLRYPLVVKPVDNMGGRGVITVETPETLEKSAVEAIRFSRTGRAIVEEFMDGPEFSIDSLIYNDTVTITGFADRLIYYPPCFIEMGHILPAKVDKETEEQIFKVFKEAVKALGITLGAAKGDIKLTTRGVMIGEIAARLSGGYMSGWTYPYASGIQLVEEGMRLAMGLEPGNLKETQQNCSSERAFISIPGKIMDILNLEEAHDLKNVKDIFLISDKGDQVRFPLNNVMKCGNVIAVAPLRGDAIKTSEEAVSIIRILLERGEPETLDFLSAPLNSQFPPSAYKMEDWEELVCLRDFKPDYSMKYKEGPVPVPQDGTGEVFLQQKDWNCLSLEKALEEILTERNLRKTDDSSWTLFAKHFWYSFLRGGIQGALWYIDQNDEAH